MQPPRPPRREGQPHPGRPRHLRRLLLRHLLHHLLRYKYFLSTPNIFSRLHPPGGSWLPSHRLARPRTWHSSWTSPSGLVVLGGGRPRGPAPAPSCSPPPAGTRSRTSRSNTKHCQSRHESRLLMVDYLIEFQTKVRGDFTITEIVKSSRTFVKTLLPMFLLQASLRYRAGRPGCDHGRQLPLCQPGHGVRGRGLGGGPAQPQHREV